MFFFVQLLAVCIYFSMTDKNIETLLKFLKTEMKFYSFFKYCIGKTNST